MMPAWAVDDLMSPPIGHRPIFRVHPVKGRELRAVKVVEHPTPLSIGRRHVAFPPRRSGHRHVPSVALAQILDLLWTQPGDGEVRLTIGDGPGPIGWHLTERYVALPSAASARFVAPLDSRRAALGSVLSYNRMRVSSTQLGRLATAGVLALRAERLSGGTPIHVWVPGHQETDPHRQGRTPREHLTMVLGRPDLSVGFGVHALEANYKPTLQAFGDRGEPIAFVKVGWTTPTRRLVLNEARAVRAIEEAPDVEGVGVPQLLAETAWSGLDMTCLRPLPLGVRRHPGGSPVEGAVLARITGQPKTLALLTSPWWLRILADLRAVAEDPGVEPAYVAAVEAYAARLATSARAVPMAAWHGDWVPWNLAVEGTKTHVFDLEHWSPAAPVGFDLVHWVFQSALVTQQRPAMAAVAAADAHAAATRSGDTHVVSLYLLELAVRTLRLRSEGGLWNDQLVPHLFDVVTARAVNRLG